MSNFSRRRGGRFVAIAMAVGLASGGLQAATPATRNASPAARGAAATTRNAPATPSAPAGQSATERADALLKQALADGLPEDIDTEARAVALLYRLGHRDRAEALLVAKYAGERQQSTTRSSAVARAVRSLDAWGDEDGARAALRSMASIAGDASPNRRESELGTWATLVDRRLAAERPDEALALAAEAPVLAAGTQPYQLFDGERPECLMRVANWHADRGDLAAARKVYAQAKPLLRAVKAPWWVDGNKKPAEPRGFGEGAADMPVAIQSRIVQDIDAGRLAQARSALAKLPKGQPAVNVGMIYARLAGAYAAAGDKRGATEVLRRPEIDELMRRERDGGGIRIEQLTDVGAAAGIAGNRRLFDEVMKLANGPVRRGQATPVPLLVAQARLGDVAGTLAALDERRIERDEAGGPWWETYGEPARAFAAAGLIDAIGPWLDRVAQPPHHRRAFVQSRIGAAFGLVDLDARAAAEAKPTPRRR